MPAPVKKPLSPFSLRLTPEERVQIEKDAAGMSLGAYIRSRLFDKSLPKRRTRGKNPVKDRQALAQVLGAMGGSRLANNLNQLAKAANSGSLPVTPETAKIIQEAYEEIRWMRQLLMKALGMTGGKKP